MSQAELTRARATGDRPNEVEALYALSRVAARGGDLPGAERLAGEALVAAMRAGDRRLEERPRHVLAAVARLSGDLLRARDLYKASIALNRSLGNAETVNSEYHNLAFTELRLGNVEVARELFAAGRREVFREGWDAFVPYICVAGAALASAEGEHRRAAFMTGVADSAFAALGQVPDPDDAAELASVRAAAVDALGEEAFAAEYAQGRVVPPREAFPG
ncbi:tetratricopeptide repeat protein [Actinoplanes sp. NPDC051513]|uniref:tetratricopeptide repeat protein n=1 Tax=Actinoplanes sp. NPDC051513 TaxID=3363908 RepID=UPI00379BBDBC